MTGGAGHCHLTAAEQNLVGRARGLAGAVGRAELSAWLAENDPADTVGFEGSDSPLLYPAALGIAQHLLSELLLIIDAAAARPGSYIPRHNAAQATGR